MKNKYLILILLVLFFRNEFHSQQQNVLIIDNSSTTYQIDNSSLLDLYSTSKGVLLPRVSLISSTDGSTITLPATSLMVYNTNSSMTNGAGVGYYYNAGTPAAPNWQKILASNTIGEWKLLGNGGTSASTNFLGTTDNVDLVFRTNNLERIRTLGSNGKVGIGTAAPAMRLDVTDASTTTDDATIRGTATGAAKTYGVYGTTTSITTNASGVKGEANGAGSVNGVWGSSSASGGAGVFGLASATTGIGVFAFNTNIVGTGLLVSGNNSTAYTLATTGSGAAFNGIPIGAVSYGNVAANGWGICAAGNNNNTSTINGGGGGSFSGNQWGVFSVATLTSPNATDRSTFVGNYYANSTTPVTVYVGARIGGTHYKILGTTAGSVSTTMSTRSGERILFAPEAPENWFFDIGEIQLINGKAIVKIDSIFVDCISESVPFKVFVQGAEETFGSIRVKRNQKEKTFELEDIGGPSNGIVQYSVYGIWKTKENLRFPEFTPDMHQKLIDMPKIKSNENNKIK